VNRRPTPRPPSFQAPTTASVGGLYTYQVKVNDPDGAAPKFYLYRYNPDMVLNVDSGLLTWIPSAGGTQTVEIRVDDQRGGVSTQRFTINVTGRLSIARQ